MDTITLADANAYYYAERDAHNDAIANANPKLFANTNMDTDTISNCVSDAFPDADSFRLTVLDANGDTLAVLDTHTKPDPIGFSVYDPKAIPSRDHRSTQGHRSD